MIEWRALCMSLLSVPLAADAHHSFAEYDTSVVVEHEGEVVGMLWRNPHVRLSVRSEAAGGNVVDWGMEAQDLNTLGRIGVSRDLIREGQRVRFAGYPSLKRDAYMVLTHLLLLDSGTEIVMRRNQAPRWTEDAIGGGDITSDPRLTDAAPADGIFRVWSYLRNQTPPMTADPPLTESARAALAAFDPSADDPVLNCAQPGMPEAISFIGPHPIEFVDRGDTILLRIESDDVTRVIHMSDGLVASEQPLSPLGFSVGRWEDENTLVVTTTRVGWPWIKLHGLVAVPQSAASVTTERFTMSDNQTRLTLSFEISDPASFTRNLLAPEYEVWRWLPGARIEPYDCTLGG